MPALKEETMSLISNIQQSIIGDQSIAPTLLKLRLLATKLDSKELERPCFMIRRLKNAGFKF